LKNIKTVDAKVMTRSKKDIKYKEYVSKIARLKKIKIELFTKEKTIQNAAILLSGGTFSSVVLNIKYFTFSMSL
jgi:hypothetical protein